MHHIEVMNSVLASNEMLWALIGFRIEDFDRILGEFRAGMTAADAPLFRDDYRKHDVGNRCKMCPKHVLLLTLLYVKTSITQEGISAFASVV